VTEAPILPAANISTLKNVLLRYGLVLLVVAAITYGSLYPFAFSGRGSFGADLAHLAGTWKERPQSRGDLLQNLLLYLPLGVSAMLAFGRGARKFPAAILAAGLGALLSFSIELAQFFDTERVSSLSDFYMNVISAIGGVAVAWSGGIGWTRTAWPSGARAVFARLLLLAWPIWRLYPYVPTIDLHKYWHSVRPLIFEIGVSGYDVFRYTVIWLGMAFLLETGFKPRRPARLLAVVMMGVVAAKIMIVGQSLSREELLGEALAFVVSAIFLWRYRTAGIIGLAVLLIALVVSSRVLPWQIVPAHKAFQWIPFYGLLHGSLQVDVISLAEKFTLYGTVILVLLAAGVPLWTAVLLEFSLLFATSWLQLYMPGRSAEITDAVLVLVLGFIYAMMQRQYPAAGKTAQRRNPGVI
jgi:VanZ family protein